MIQLIGVDHTVPIEIRESFAIIKRRVDEKLDALGEIFIEVVLISTCNRTEVYFKSADSEGLAVEKLFKALDWNLEHESYAYHKRGRGAVEHLMHLSCGFYSVVKGEEQILSQIKRAYEQALSRKTVKTEFTRLFKKVIRCGKEFRHNSNLYRIPVSSSSIAISEAKKRGLKRFMIIGYGEVGELSLKYVLSSEHDKVYIVVKDETDMDFYSPKVEFIKFKNREHYYGDVECIVSSTSAPHTVVNYSESLRGKLIFDLAVPRDVEEALYESDIADVYGIDDLKEIDGENQKKRQIIMDENRYIVKKYIDEFYHWKSTENLTPTILEIKEKSSRISEERIRTFKNKKDTKDVEELAAVLIKSTSKAYVNRAIEVLKEESEEGKRDICIEIIKKIFC